MHDIPTTDINELRSLPCRTYLLYAVTISYDSSGCSYFPIDGGHPGLQSISLSREISTERFQSIIEEKNAHIVLH